MVFYEIVFVWDFEVVFNGDMDYYCFFVVNMMIVISLVKVDRWVGLLDIYYFVVMEYFDYVVRLKDLKIL